MGSAGILAHAVWRALKGAGRLITLRRVSPADFEPSADVFAALIALYLGLMFALAVAAFGLHGQLNLAELPRALMYVPMVLGAGLLARHTAGAGTPLLLLPVAYAAASVWTTTITWGLYMLAQHDLLPYAETYWLVMDETISAWSAAVVLSASYQLLGGSVARRTGAGIGGLALIVLPLYWFPQGVMWLPPYDESAAQAASFHTLAEERAFYVQEGALERELEAVQPERPGIADVYVIAAALYAGEDVFMKEVRMITTLLGERFDAAGRTVTLVNNVKTLDEHPIATLTSIRESLKRVGETMNKDEDVLVLYLSSHGSAEHELTVDFRPLRLTAITPARLRAALDESGIRWKVIVVSACYSGAFLDALKDERTLVITASRADRKSLGCGYTLEATYLGKALFDQALRKTYSFEVAFAEARGSIEQWEKELQHVPSEPQIYVGAQIRPKLAQVEKRLAALPRARR